MEQKQLRCLLAATMLVALASAPALAETAWAADLDAPTTFSLTQLAPQPAGGAGASMESWDVEGPVSMRSADVQEAGTMDLKNVFEYATSSDGTDGDVRYLFELQWGVYTHHELALKVPVNIGDGASDGNADVSVGWQWHLWEESGMMPAFAVYNELRLPTGYQSSGVDWEFRGIMTKTLMGDELRMHVNPFVRVLDGDNVEANAEPLDDFFNPQQTARTFAAGGVVGFDYRLTDTATVNVDYVLDSGALDGYRMQHSMDAGIDYAIAPGQVLSWSTHWTLDGDTQGDDWGFALSYIFSLDAPSF